MEYSGKAGFTDNINGSDISFFTAIFHRSGPPAWLQTGEVAGTTLPWETT
jgi:hypothetical protein